MPLDVARILAAPPVRTSFSWTDHDVRLYHLALGATEIHYTYEGNPGGLAVLPLFGVARAGIGFTVFDTPGVDIDLSQALHGGQHVTVHRPLPTTAKEATAVSRVTSVYDKGRAAVLIQESDLLDEDGRPLLTQRNEIFVRGEGGFGGDRGPSARTPDMDRDPDHVLDLATLPQQALLYRLTGDANPLHADPQTAAKAGYDRPILHGLCTFGIAVKAVTDHFLGGDPATLASCRTRFAGVAFPGERLCLEVWTENSGHEYRSRVTAPDRGNAPVLTDFHLTSHD